MSEGFDTAEIVYDNVVDAMAAIDAIAQWCERRAAEEQMIRTEVDKAIAVGCGVFVDKSGPTLKVIASPLIPAGQGIVYTPRGGS